MQKKSHIAGNCHILSVESLGCIGFDKGELVKTILMIMFWALALVAAVGLIIFGAVSAFSDNTDETN